MVFSIEYANVFSNILADENIQIRIDSTADTASFNLNSRVLTLPQWDGGRELLRYLCCHEISHAIFTPCKEWLDAIEARPTHHQSAYMGVLNVFEDARVDRLMTEKYVAMVRWYAEGNHEFVNVQDLWGIAHDPGKATEFSLIDRINLYYKTLFIANPYNLDFPAPDDQWISRTDAARTFDEIKAIADDFFDQMSQEEQESGEEVILVVGSGNFNIETEISETQADIQKLAKRLVQITHVSPGAFFKEYETLYVPDSSYKSVLSSFKSEIEVTDKPVPNRSLVNKMASVFQRKKNAKLYSNVMTNKTGIIDPLKLFSYKFNEDILLRKTIVDKQKNHGFIMIVDTSSSMRGIWKDVVEHLFILALFCKQINVPFEVYGFTNGSSKCAITDTDFSIRPFFSSSDSIGMITDMMPKLFSFSLCGFTPLTSTIHYSKTMTIDFMAKHQIDVMNVIFLTDGGCTNTVRANVFVDKNSRYMVSPCEDFLGNRTGVGPLVKILRHRTKANVWMYHIKPGDEYEFKEECGGMSGVFTIGKNLLKTNPNLFVDGFVDKMSVFGGTLVDS